MKSQKLFLVFVLVIGAFLLQACGAGTQAAIETGIAQTQQISELQTQAAAGGSQPTQESAATATETATASTAVEVTTVRDVNMRSGDSTSYGVMTVIPGNTTLPVTGVNADATWYQIEYHGAVGWISAQFTQGDVPADLPVVTPSAVASSGGGGGGGGGGSGNDSFTFTLNLTHDGESKTVQGQLTPGDNDTVTVKFEGLGSNDTGHLVVTLSCSAGENDVELSESIPRSNHSNECNGDWEYQIESNDGQLVIGMTLPSNFNGNVDWVMTVEVHT